MNKIIYLLPVFTLCALVFLQIKTTIDAQTITLTNETVPHFDLEEMSFLSPGQKRITPDDLPDDLVMINFFASWCSTCKIEHNQLMALAEEHKLNIVGIAFKDDTRDISNSMSRLGNPYTRIAIDKDGYAAAGWRISGTPESFFIDASGKVRYHFRGPIREKDLTQTILPVIKTIREDMGKGHG